MSNTAPSITPGNTPQRSHPVAAKAIGIIVLIGGLFLGFSIVVVLSTSLLGRSVDGTFVANNCVVGGRNSGGLYRCTGEFTPDATITQTASSPTIHTNQALSIGQSYRAYSLLGYGKTQIDDTALFYLKGDSYSRVDNLALDATALVVSLVFVRFGWSLLKKSKSA